MAVDHNASMAGLYRRKDLAKRLLDEFGEMSLPDDGFSKGPVQSSSWAALPVEAIRISCEWQWNASIFPMATRDGTDFCRHPFGFWNHWFGPSCHHDWDRSTYLTCFKMILERSGPPNAPLNSGATILHQIVVMGSHVAAEERVAFATAALEAGARLDLRHDLLNCTPLGWACRWGREELVRLFLGRGADPIEADAAPWASPLAWAEKKGHRRIAAILTGDQPG